MKKLDANTNDPRPSGEGVSVLAKISALLEILSSRDQATAAELAELLDEPRSSVHRTLRQLADIGWIEPAGQRGQWAIGLHLFRLGSGAVQRMDVRRAALPQMRTLNALSGETVLLCVRRGLEAVCIERIEGHRVQSIALVLGGSIPLHLGAGPSVLLAWADESVHKEWLVAAADHGVEKMNTAEPPTIGAIEARLEEVRSRGYAISDRDVTQGIAAIGAPVFDFTGRVVAAVSVSGIAESVLDPELGLAEHVMHAASKISFELGQRQ
jgi:DNA-binding IclR family transcriptional regulator